jgi:hypothetical protein
MRLLGEVKSLLEQTHGEIPMVWTSPSEKASPFESPSMCFVTSWQRTPDIIGADLDEQEEMDHALLQVAPTPRDLEQMNEDLRIILYHIVSERSSMKRKSNDRKHVFLPTPS